MKPTISIDGAWAVLRGAPAKALEDCLVFLDPKRFHNRAFKERRWDGKVRLFSGRKFPSGLTEHVIKHFNDAGEDVTTVGKEEKVPIDTSRFDATYLGPIGPGKDDLREDQCQAILSMLKHKRGVVKSPTASGKTEMIAAVARYLWEERGWRSLIVVPRKGLAKQTRQRLTIYFDGDLEVGQCGDGEKTIGTVTVCTAQTLIGFRKRTHKKRTIPPDPELAKLVADAEVLFLDEAHHASAATWYDIAMHSGAIRRYGLSGTPLKNNEIADMKLIGATGPLIHEVAADTLIEAGAAARPKIVMVMAENASGPTLPVSFSYRQNPKTGKLIKIETLLPYKEAYPRGITGNSFHNAAVVRASVWLADQGKKTLVICRRKDHWRTLGDLFRESAATFDAVWGATDTETRDLAKRDFIHVEGGAVLLATTIFDEGEDVPNIDAIVLAEGVKVSTNAIQRIGRGMRRKTGINEVWIVDFVPTCHKRLGEHALERAKAYEGEGYEVTLLETWPHPDHQDFDDEHLLPFLNWDAVEA